MSALLEAVEKIEDLIVDGNQASAAELLEASFSEFGRTQELLVLQVELVLDEEDFPGTIKLAKEIDEGVKDEEWRARLFTVRGYGHFYDDEAEEARLCFNTAIGYDSDLLNAVTGRAIVHEDLGFPNAALLDLDRVIEQDDEDSLPFEIRASIHILMGNVEIAEGDLDHAVRLSPHEEESRLQLGRIHALMQRTAPAMEALGWLVDEGKSPDFVVPATILRSQLSLTMNAHDAAIDDAQRAIDAMPDAPWGYLQQAASIIAQGADGGRAIELLKIAESKVPTVRDLPDLYSLRASAYEIMGKTEKAQEIRDDAEGVARLPAFVYGPLNPVSDIPINPRKPLDVRALLEDLFGDAEDAPEGYEAVLRQVADQLPNIIKENPGIGKIHVDLPEAPGMIGGKRQLVINVGKGAS